MSYLDEKALEIVKNYSMSHTEQPLRGFDIAAQDVCIIWKYNFTYVLKTANVARDGRYYKVTYDNDKREWNLKVFKMFDEQIIKE